MNKISKEKKRLKLQLNVVKLETKNEYKVTYRGYLRTTITIISTLVSGGLLLVGCTESNSPIGSPEQVVNPSPSVIEPTTSSSLAAPSTQQKVSEEPASTQQNTSQANSVPTPTGSAKLNWGTLHSKEGKINLRSGPGTINKAIGYGVNGDRVQILDTARDAGSYSWYKVKFSKSSAEGWIAGQLIQMNGSVTEDKPNKPQERAEESSNLQQRVLEETPNIATGAKCSDFSTQAQAQAALSTNPQLDRDKDGVACESLR